MKATESGHLLHCCCSQPEQVQVDEKEKEIDSVRGLLATADEALNARDAVVAALKAREATLSENLDAAKVTISEFEERVASLRKTSDSLQEQVCSFFCFRLPAGVWTSLFLKDHFLSNGSRLVAALLIGLCASLCDGV